MYGKQAKYNLALSLSLMRGYIRNVVKRKRKVLKIAHRGASRYAPENTLEAFRKAVKLKVDAIEFDIHHTKDGKLITMHDHNKVSNISQLSYRRGYIQMSLIIYYA